MSGMSIKKKIRISIYTVLIGLLLSFFSWSAYTFVKYDKVVSVTGIAENKYYDTGKYGDVSFIVVYQLEGYDRTVTRYYYESEWNDIKIGDKISTSVELRDAELTGTEDFLSFFGVFISSICFCVGAVYLCIIGWKKYLSED